MVRAWPIAVLVLLCSLSWGQVPPIVGGGATAFDPEISVLHSGAVFDAQAVVSPDRRYVTINATPQQAGVIAFRDFRVQQVASAGAFRGFVGGGDPLNGLASVANTPSSVTWITLNPSEQDLQDVRLLERPGMIRLRGP
ncbi:MAG: hypothetical protein NZ561_07700 [Phycisphaerae bacterium]|nr:hypothetical protein [Phycisphaerae bacterium]MDW8261165.1 hypothetical protein [Phycisphaerales bacterium]